MSKRNFFTLSLIFSVVLGVSAAVGYVLLQNAAPTDTLADTAAVFSDILSPIFAGLAFGGLIFTVILQSRELALQRQEITQTREELAKTADANERTAQALNAQAKYAKHTARVNALREYLDFLDETVKAMKNKQAQTSDYKRSEHIEQVSDKRHQTFNKLLDEIAKYTADDVTGENDRKEDS